MWAELEAQFDVVDGTKIHGLKTQLHNCKQIKGMDVTTYFGKLKTIWDSLVLHEPPFACTCGKCECGIAKAALQRLDNERLHQFFMGLDSSLYGHVRSQQFQLDPLPSLSRAYSVVLQQERLRDESAPDVSEVTAFAVPNSSRPPVDWRERRQLFCSHCETKGHDLTSCFFKTNKFPPWWGDRPRTLEGYRRYRTNLNRSGSGTGSSVAGSSSASDKSNMAHVNALISGATAHSLLDSDRLSGMCNWILDTGASNHVTESLSCLEDVQTIHGRPDRSLRTTIGVGELRDGLYWIQAGKRHEVANTLTTNGTYELWHRRMGHPSDSCQDYPFFK
ncbi:uncharacterized protein LOC141648822 [Silene latifolia]|uniref:uncharacterized protein LOC141648822 n=1 Tax=Silene latifolia TaxID=37657 RepID=UPI003D7723C3